MDYTVKTVRLNEEEAAAVKQHAQALGMYEHGYIRACIRLGLGLEVERRFRDHVAQQLRRLRDVVTT